MDEFLIQHIGMTHPPIWMMWVSILYVACRFFCWLGKWYDKYN